MRPLILYHANCPDGFCAAWIAHRKYGADADYVPVQYGQDPPEVKGREVFILDFSYKRDVMRRILAQAQAVVVLDHHKTAGAELAGLVDEFVMRPDRISNPPGSDLPLIHFDMNKSGGRLAWEYFFKDVLVSWLVDYTEDRDLWRWKLPESAAVSAALAAYPHEFARWQEWAASKTPPPELIAAGRGILQYQEQLTEKICACAAEVDLGGHRVLAANTSCLFSEVAGKLAEGRPFGAAWFIRSDGRKQWALRSSNGGVDVSEIARAHGGGGHRNAAGFEE